MTTGEDGLGAEGEEGQGRVLVHHDRVNKALDGLLVHGVKVRLVDLIYSARGVRRRVEA